MCKNFNTAHIWFVIFHDDGVITDIEEHDFHEGGSIGDGGSNPIEYIRSRFKARFTGEELLQKGEEFLLELEEELKQ